MELVDIKDIQKLLRFNRMGGEVIGKLLLQFFRSNKLKKIYSKNIDKDGPEFIDSVIKQLDISIEVNPDDLKKIPEKGAFITVSNHPLGGIDGLVLLKIILEKRDDFKILENHYLKKIEPLNDYIFNINLYEINLGPLQNLSGVKGLMAHLQEGKPAGFFPSMEKSGYFNENGSMADSHWRYDILKFIKKAGVPVIPIHFKGNKNSVLQFFRLLHPLFRTMNIHPDMLQKKNKFIKVSIGSPITPKEIGGFYDINRLGRFLRLKTYAIGTTLEVKRYFKPRTKKTQYVEPVVDAEPVELLVEEIEKLKSSYLLFSQKKYHILCAPSMEMPRTLNEIGRLREITFRDVGEGTNRSTDLDEYDLYYNQLIIWDSEENKIVGAYRMGRGKDILNGYGIQGFYINSLFKIKEGLSPVLQESIELGRSFIVKEYQREPMSLFLLWKGILYFLINNPEYRYLIGPVSISNRYSTLSKALIVEFIKANFFDNELAKYVEPRTRFKVHFNKNIEKEVMLEYTESDIKKFDKFIKDVEPYYTMPVLLKKYLQQNAKIIGFNVDPDFNNCLDGLIILDLFDVPTETIESMTKEMGENIEVVERIFAKETIAQQRMQQANQ